jgi:hypothetical protein
MQLQTIATTLRHESHSAVHYGFGTLAQLQTELCGWPAVKLMYGSDGCYRATALLVVRDAGSTSLYAQISSSSTARNEPCRRSVGPYMISSWYMCASTQHPPLLVS